MRSSKWLLIVPVTVILCIACGRQGTAQGASQPVRIILTCPPNLEVDVPGGATVAPYRRSASPGDTIEWRLQVAGTGTKGATFTVSSDNWPLPDDSYGDDDGDNVITAPVPQGAPAGQYKYTITMECNGSPVVLDPGMRIG